MHLNLQDACSTPHGSDSPGSGPVACKKILEPFLPTPVVKTNADGCSRSTTTARRASAASAPGTATSGMFIRALAYILANGPDGLRQTTEDAVLNANYIRAKHEHVRASLQDPYAA